MKRILYLGTDPTQFQAAGEVIHFPVIKIVPRAVDSGDLDAYTHTIFTSKHAVRIVAERKWQLRSQIIAVGAVTAAHLALHGMPTHHVAIQETQEGIIALLKTLPLEDAYLFLPRSSRSRPALVHFLQRQGVLHRTCDLYDTITNTEGSPPDLRTIDEIVFTSPSTVSAFIEIFGALPRNQHLVAVGPVTEEALKNCSPDLYCH